MPARLGLAQFFATLRADDFQHSDSSAETAMELRQSARNFMRLWVAGHSHKSSFPHFFSNRLVEIENPPRVRVPKISRCSFLLVVEEIVEVIHDLD